jgi:hypothetical protein
MVLEMSNVRGLGCKIIDMFPFSDTLQDQSRFPYPSSAIKDKEFEIITIQSFGYGLDFLYSVHKHDNPNYDKFNYYITISL